jgi:hypothetical protein
MNHTDESGSELLGHAVGAERHWGKASQGASEPEPVQTKPSVKTGRVLRKEAMEHIRYSEQRTKQAPLTPAYEPKETK